MVTKQSFQSKISFVISKTVEEIQYFILLNFQETRSRGVCCKLGACITRISRIYYNEKVTISFKLHLTRTEHLSQNHHKENMVAVLHSSFVQTQHGVS